MTFLKFDGIPIFFREQYKMFMQTIRKKKVQKYGFCEKRNKKKIALVDEQCIDHQAWCWSVVAIFLLQFHKIFILKIYNITH